MLRVVLDPNVLVSALISPAGVPAQVIDAVLDGDVDHVASLWWLSEADGLAERPRFRRWFTREDAQALIERLWMIAEITPDRTSTEAFTRDPDDDSGVSRHDSFSTDIAAADSLHRRRPMVRLFRNAAAREGSRQHVVRN